MKTNVLCKPSLLIIIWLTQNHSFWNQILNLLSVGHQVKNPIRIIKGAHFESDASELNNESVEPMLTDISPSESSEMEQSPNEADLVWLDPNPLKKADSLESAEIPELFQLSSKKDLAELGKTEFGQPF